MGHSHSQRINTMVLDIIKSSWAVTGLKPTSAQPVIKMSPRVLEASNNLRHFLFERVYQTKDSKGRLARGIVRLIRKNILLPIAPADPM